jgi:periplasmic protein CpxP/Spy
MTEPTPATPATSTSPAPRRPGRARRLLLILLTVVTAGLGGAAVATAMGNGPGFGHFGHGFGGPWHGRGMMGMMDPAAIEERADKAVRHLAIEVNASGEQQDKLRAIMKTTVRELLPMRERMRSGHEQIRALLTQPTVDRAAVEKFRAEHLTLAEAFSKRVAQSITEAAEVLTPEQRRQISERIPARHYWRG